MEKSFHLEKYLCRIYKPFNSHRVAMCVIDFGVLQQTCSLCCCISVSAKVSFPYRHAGVTQVFSKFALVVSTSVPHHCTANFIHSSFANKKRKARLRWFGHVKRQDQEYIG